MEFEFTLDLKNSGTRISLWDSPTRKKRASFFRRSIAPAKFPLERP